MNEPDAQISGKQVDTAWSSIEDTLNQLALRARERPSPDEFYADLLSELAQACHADAAALWGNDDRESIEILFQHDADSPHVDPRHYRDRQQTAHEACQNASTQLRDARGQTITDVSWHGDSYLFIALDNSSIAVRRPVVIELCFANKTSAAAIKRAQQIATVFGEVALDYATQQELHRLRHEHRRSATFLEFLQQIYRTDDLTELAAIIANDGRQLLGCHRLAVLAGATQSFRLLAVSGVDTIDRNSRYARAIERLGAALAYADCDLVYPLPNDQLEPQIENLLQAYLDESPAKQLQIALLRMPTRSSDDNFPARDNTPQHSNSISGVLVAESFQGSPLSDPDGLFAALQPHCGLALERADRERRRPLRRLTSLLEHGLSAVQRKRFAMGTVLLLTLALLLWAIKGTYYIEAQGTLQPTERFEVFAGTSGVISQVHVSHGQMVEQGELLATLEDSQLELQLSQVLGELTTTQQRLQASRARRLHPDAESASVQAELSLAAEEQQLTQQIAGLEQQRQILTQQKERLQVRSPATGTVLTWDPRKQLQNRPVQIGNRLMTIANLSGPWHLELWVDDHQVSELQSADPQHENSNEAEAIRHPVTFLMSTNASRSFRGEVESIALTTEHKPKSQVRIMAQINEDQVLDRRTGASVVAKIDAGRRRLGYIWFRDLYRTLSSWWF